MFWVSVVVFFTLGPALIFYAQGYRFVSTDRSVVSTGNLVVSSRPVNADISLNGTPLGVRTPYTIDSLDEGEYTLTLNSDEYLPWSKTLMVKPGASTFASDIRLIKDSNARLLNEQDSLFYDPKSRRGYITIKESDNGLAVEFNRSQLLSNLFQSSRRVEVPVVDVEVIEAVAWQSTDDRLVLKTDSQYWLLDFSITDQPVKELTPVIPANYRAIHWSTRNNDELVAVTSNSIILINLAAITKREVPNVSEETEIFSDAFIVGNSIYVITSTDEKAKLNIINISGDLSLITELSGLYHEYIDHHNGLIILRTRSGELQVYHSNGSSYRPGYTFPYVTEVLFNSSRSEILFTNGNELYMYSVKNDSLNLLVRQAVPMNNIDWFEDSHASYLSGSTVYLIERDGRNGHVNWELAIATNLSKYFINNTFDKLYYIARENGGKYIYEKEI